MSDLGLRAVQRASAAASLPVTEQPPGSNSGPQVNVYLASVGLKPGNPWCAAFACYCIHRAAAELGIVCVFPNTGSSSAIWRWAKASGNLLAAPEAPCVALIRGGATGWEHTCFVTHVDPVERMVDTIDGNWGSAVRVTEHLMRTCAWVRIV